MPLPLCREKLKFINYVFIAFKNPYLLSWFSIHQKEDNDRKPECYLEPSSIYNKIQLVFNATTVNLYDYFWRKQ